MAWPGLPFVKFALPSYPVNQSPSLVPACRFHFMVTPGGLGLFAFQAD